MQLRTVESAYKAIKEADPDTAVTKNFIRQAVTIGRIPSVSAGKKRLFTMEDLQKYIESEIERSRTEYEEMVEQNKKS